MSHPHVAVIYYSATGTVSEIARNIAKGALAAGAGVRLARIEETAGEAQVARNPKWQAHIEADRTTPVATVEDVRWADAVILGSPTRFGSVTHQAQRFIDSLGALWMNNELAGKVFSAFTAASTHHGGHEATLLSLFATFANWGGIIVPPGYTSDVLKRAGTPLGVSQTVSSANPLTEGTLAAAREQGRRVAEIAAKLRSG